MPKGQPRVWNSWLIFFFFGGAPTRGSALLVKRVPTQRSTEGQERAADHLCAGATLLHLVAIVIDRRTKWPHINSVSVLERGKLGDAR
jgi:hypothetical protein